MGYNSFKISKKLISKKLMFFIFLGCALILLFLFKGYFTLVERYTNAYGGGIIEMIYNQYMLMYPQLASQIKSICDTAYEDLQAFEKQNKEFENSPERFTNEEWNQLQQAKTNNDKKTEQRLQDKLNKSSARAKENQLKFKTIMDTLGEKLKKLTENTPPVDPINMELSKVDWNTPATADEYAKMEEKRRQVIDKIGKMAKIYGTKIGGGFNTELYNTDLTNAQQEVSTEQASVDSYNSQLKGNYNPLQVMSLRSKLSEANTKLTNAKKTVTDLESFKQEFDTYQQETQDFYQKIRSMFATNPPPTSTTTSTPPPTSTTTSTPEPATPPTASPNNPVGVWENPRNEYLIQNAAPNYPNYKFKGCWRYGQNQSHAVLNKMVSTKIPTMDECVHRVSKQGLHSAAYDGSGICFGGGSEYATYTPVNCETTYDKGKSWLVYSTDMINK